MFCCLSILGEQHVKAGMINFDDVPGHGIRRIPSYWYQSQGVLLDTDGVGIFVFGPDFFTTTPPNWLYGSSFPDGGGADADVILSFVVPGTRVPATVSKVSFFLTDGDGGAIGLWTASIYDIDGNLLDVLASTAGGNAAVSFSRSTRDIHRVVFSPSSEIEGIDTLRFGSVPEPSSILLVGASLAGIGWQRQKRVRERHS
jgi:hypothetical protein